jgi:hypothetical protein
MEKLRINLEPTEIWIFKGCDRSGLTLNWRKAFHGLFIHPVLPFIYRSNTSLISMGYIVLMFIFAIHWISVLIDVILAYIMFPVFNIIPFVKAPRHL